MASETRTVDLKYRADIAQLRSELAKVPGVTEKEAKKLVGALDKQLKRAEKAAKRTSKSTKGTFKGLEDSAGEADSVLQGLASGLDLVDPKLGSVARMAGDAAGGIEAIARSAPIGIAGLGAIGVAVAALGALYLTFKKDLDEATAKQDRAAESARLMAAAYTTLKDGVQKLEDEFGLMTGEIDAFDIELREKLASAAAAYKPMIAQQGKLVKSIVEERDALRGAINTRKLHGETLESAQGRLQVLNRVLSKQAGVLSMLKGDYDDARGKIDLLVDHKRDLAAATEDEEATTRGATAAYREYGEVQREIEMIFDERQRTVEALQKIEDAARLSTLDGEARILYQRDLQLEQIDALMAKTGELQVAEETRAAVVAQAEHEISRLRAAEVQDLDQIAASGISASGAAAGYFGEISSGVSAIFGELAQFEGMDEDASRVFSILQEIAGLLSNLALSIGGFMSGNVGAGLMGVAGGIGNISGLAGLFGSDSEEEQAAQPVSVYHTGASFSRSGDPSEVDARLLRSEMGGILTRQGQAALGGPGAIQAANAGMNPGRSVAVFQLDHRVVQTALERSAERGGSLRRLVLGSNPRLGHFHGAT